ncbi:MAG: tripartite tricarboxylate transporter TctB family protein [Alphaproteobacteria bacterium]|nr:tripartite tricarboxylate transporter TctB family protein [Alphaproteobacteria bacterium]MDP6814558.1 tripartite tricarboxylate transporter TctB family protein [Alphaproteobacteria bacterium]
MTASDETPTQGGPSMRATDLMAGIVLGLAALLALIWLIPNYTAPAQSELDLAPGLIPSVAMWICLLLALLLVRKGLPFGRQGAAHEDEEFGAEASGIGRHEAVNVGLWALTAIVTMTLLHIAGFIVAGAVMLAAVMFYARQRNYWILVAIAAAMPIALYWLVWFAFTIELP